MTALVLVFCLIGDANTCQEQRPMLDDPSPMACLLAAEWIAEHPKWEFRRYRCEMGKRQERAA